MQVALGFRTHSGWAAVVAVGLSPGPVVCDRRTIVLADSSIPGSRQPYHAAEPMPIAKAKQYLDRCTDVTHKLAVSAMTATLDEMRLNGHDVVACGLLAGSGRATGSVEAILASHPAIHTAEGELYRNAIAHACDACQLPLTRLREKEAENLAAAALHASSATIERTIAAMGKPIGPPWSQDQKLAALAAWVALANAAPRRVKAARRTA